MKILLQIALIQIVTISYLLGQASPGLTGASFTPSTIAVGQTSMFETTFINGFNADPIPNGGVGIQIQFAQNFYVNDGVTHPTGAGAALFDWQYYGNGIWFGTSNTIINALGGGPIQFIVTGAMNTNQNPANSTVTVQPNMGGDQNTGDNTLTAGLVVDAALPIQLLAFSAEKQELQSYLQWATATEINNEYFQVERSRDGENFDPIGQVAGAGNSSLRKDYNFIDAHPIQGVNYYRLRQVDVDGLYSFSPIRALKFDLREHVFIYPNPSKSYAIVETPDVLRGCTMEVFDIHGKKYVEIELNSDKQEVMMDNWPSGSYTVKIVKKETHYEDTRTLIKQQ